MLVEDLVNLKLDNGRYLVKSKLGEGGMGAVYLGHDTRLDSEVVVKVPHRAMLAEAGFRDRFQREIQSLVKLMHPHIVKVIDVGEYERIPFAVMQYLGGGSLSELRKRDHQNISKLADWLVPIAKALDFIHKKNYIHRDVKPANILFDDVGNAFLGDFGIAKVAAESEEKKRQKSLTGTGIAMGTPEYMAPELCDGRSIDKRVDQYALGVTVYEYLAGRCPLIGATPLATIFMHKTHQPDALSEHNPEVSRDVSDIVHKAMSKEPGERFDSCLEFADALLDFGVSGKRPKSTAMDTGTFPKKSDETNTQNVADLLVEVPPDQSLTPKQAESPHVPTNVPTNVPPDVSTDDWKADSGSSQKAPPPLPLAEQPQGGEDQDLSSPATVRRENAATTPHQESQSRTSDPAQQRRDPCPSCGKSLRVPAQMLGRIVVCPNCSTKLSVRDFGLKEFTGRPPNPQTATPQPGASQPATAQPAKGNAASQPAPESHTPKTPAKPEPSKPEPAAKAKPKRESSTPKWVIWFWILFIFFGGLGALLIFFINSQDENTKQILRDDIAAWERAYIMDEEGTQKYLERNVDSKLSFWKRHADKGNANAQVLYGDCFEMGVGVEKDLGKAISWYQRAADQKNAAGIWALGNLYHQGKGVQRDQKKGVELFRQAAESGYSSAQYSLARSYYYGYGIKESKSIGTTWYQKAAENGNAKAQYQVGYMHQNGIGVTKDEKLAFSWYLKAAKSGYATAQNHVGICYRTGKGVKKDEAEALQWYRRAAAQGNKIGLYNVGVCYESGYSVPRDLTEAKKWYQKSADKGYQSAIDRLKKLKGA